METEGGGNRVGERGRAPHPCLPPRPSCTYYLRTRTQVIPETDGRKLGLSAGLGSWYELGVTVGAREWRCRLSRGKDDDKVACSSETGKERDYRTDSDDLTSWALRLGELGRKPCERANSMSIDTQSRLSQIYTNKRQQGSEVTKYSTGIVIGTISRHRPEL